MRTSAVVIPLLVALTACSKAPPSIPGAIAIRVDNKGFQPSAVFVKRGSAATLVFTRTTDVTCATEVVLPELSIRKELPLGEPVVVPVPTEADRKLTFQCGKGQFRGAVVISAN
ncbi:MAG: cupredoxin domain-containing protein [Deltaproteobacteria bacterium]|nr:cupredoxin domain-containing protein [Deltaproteobacteria bacterium]